MLLAICLTGATAAQAPAPAALHEMVAAERAFAATARVKGVRDAFLEFFADDAMFDPAAGLAKDQLRKQPPQPFSVRELVWEPRTGDIAASGELGWLTGPGTFVNHAGPDKTPRHTNYLSIWRKQADGWRVFIDVGTNLQAPAAFAPGFVRFPFGARYQGKEGKAAAGAGLEDADRALNARLPVAGAAAAYREALAPGARVHREGSGALVDPAAIAAWFDQHAKAMTAATRAAESALSGDLGYTYGSYQAGGEPGRSGTYLRVWTREGSGRWRVVADVLLPPR